MCGPGETQPQLPGSSSLPPHTPTELAMQCHIVSADNAALLVFIPHTKFHYNIKKTDKIPSGAIISLKNHPVFQFSNKGNAHAISAFLKSNKRVNRLSSPISRYLLTAVTTQTCATQHNTTQHNRNNNSAAYPEPRSHLRKKRTKNTALEQTQIHMPATVQCQLILTTVTTVYHGDYSVPR